MKKLLILTLIFLGLGLFVYFYEIKGGEKREEAKKLEESLFRIKQDEVESLEIIRPGKEPVLIVRQGEEWVLRKPVETLADRSTVESMLRNIENARIERKLEEVEGKEEEYGLDQPRLTLTVQTSQGTKKLLIGKDDFTGTNVYARLEGEPEVFLTSDFLLTSAEKEVKDWRDKKVLRFRRDKLQVVEIERPGEDLRLRKRGEDWYLESPLEEKADQSQVSSLLSSLEFAQAQEFVAEQAENLEAYGLQRPAVRVRVQEEGDDSWKVLELGRAEDDLYLARNPDRSPIFKVRKDLYERLTDQVWEFRDKDVVDVAQDQIQSLTLQRGEEKLVLRREDWKWIFEEPADYAGKEALSYKVWYPIDDMKFQSIEAVSDFPTPTVTVTLNLKDGSVRHYDFALQGERHLARRREGGRAGTVQKEDFEKLQFELKEAVVQSEPSPEEG